MTESMNGQSREGLSRKGLATHIANAILLWKNGMGTKNDCRLVISHVLRTYHKSFVRNDAKHATNIPYTPNACAAERTGQTTNVLEHAIPILCLSNVLFKDVIATKVDDALQQVTTILADEIHLAWVTQREHQALNRQFACCMPAGFDTHPWKNIWARYDESGVPRPAFAGILCRSVRVPTV